MECHIEDYAMKEKQYVCLMFTCPYNNSYVQIHIQVHCVYKQEQTRYTVKITGTTSDVSNAEESVSESESDSKNCTDDNHNEVNSSDTIHVEKNAKL
jgi:hypothetical protein